MANTSGPINSKALIAYSHKHPAYAQALKLVTKAFAKPRAGMQSPYSSHALTVGSVLLDLHGADAPAQLMVLSALEDVLARKVLSPEELQTRFGEEMLNLVRALSPSAELVAYATALAQAHDYVREVKLASLLEHGASLPKKSVRGAAGREYLTQARVLLPSLASASAELARRVQALVDRIEPLH